MPPANASESSDSATEIFREEQLELGFKAGKRRSPAKRISLPRLLVGRPGPAPGLTLELRPDKTPRQYVLRLRLDGRAEQIGTLTLDPSLAKKRGEEILKALATGASAESARSLVMRLDEPVTDGALRQSLAKYQGERPTVGDAIKRYRSIVRRPHQKRVSPPTVREHCRGLRQLAQAALAERGLANVMPTEKYSDAVLDLVPLGMIRMQSWRYLEEVARTSRDRHLATKYGKALGAVKKMFARTLSAELRIEGMPVPHAFEIVLRTAKGTFQPPRPLRVATLDEAQLVIAAIDDAVGENAPEAALLVLSFLVGLLPRDLAHTQNPHAWLGNGELLVTSAKRTARVPMPCPLLEWLRRQPAFVYHSLIPTAIYERWTAAANARLHRYFGERVGLPRLPITWLASHGQLRQLQLTNNLHFVAEVSGLKPDSLVQKFATNQLGKPLLAQMAKLENRIGHTA